jgi:hypothetical protein
MRHYDQRLLLPAQAVGEARAMQALVACLGGLADADLALPLTFVSALVTSPPGKQFAAQFIEAGGASPAAMRRRALQLCSTASHDGSACTPLLFAVAANPIDAARLLETVL